MAAPVGHTCPDIDKVISSIKRAMQTASAARKHFGKDHEADNDFWEIEYELDGLERTLQDLRKSNSTLREWGEGLEDQVTNLENELSELSIKS